MAIGDVKVKEGETVAGRLKQFTDSNSSSMNYASALGRRVAGSRGLTNSSIAVGAAAEQVLKVGTDVAKSDANIFSQSNIAQSQNQTSLEKQKLSDTAAYDRTKLSADTQLKIQTEGDKAAKERLADQILSQEKIATQQATTQKDIQSSADAAALARIKEQITSNEAIGLAERTNKMAIANAANASALAVAQERSASASSIEAARAASALALNTASNASAETISTARNTSNETISKNNAAAIAAENALDRLNQQNIAKWNNTANLKLQEMRENFGLTSEYRSDATAAWSQYSTAIGSIDITASGASQTEQFNRVTAAFNTRMNLLNTSRIADLADKGAEATDAEAMEAYTKAIQVGMTADQLDQMGGVPAGTAAKWVQDRGLQPLKSASAESTASAVAASGAASTSSGTDTMKLEAGTKTDEANPAGGAENKSGLDR